MNGFAYDLFVYDLGFLAYCIPQELFARTWLSKTFWTCFIQSHMWNEWSSPWKLAAEKALF